MNREPQISSKSSASTAQARRLILEQLEMRSVLATMFGLPETATLAVGQTIDVERTSSAHLRPVGAFQFFSPGSSGQFDVFATELDSVSITEGENLPLAVGGIDPATWTATEPIFTSIQHLDAVAFSELAVNLQLSKGWFSINRPGIVRPIEIPVKDLPVIIDVENLPDASNDDSPADDSPADPSPTTSDPTASTPPSQPAKPPKASDAGNASARWMSWLEVEETHTTVAETLSSSSPHAEGTHHALKSQLTSNLSRQNSSTDELDEQAETKEPTSELASELLELPASRALHSNSEERSTERADGPAQLGPRAASSSVGTIVFNPLHATDFGWEVLSAVSVSDDVVASFDEGGLVELIAADTIRKISAGDGSGTSGSIRTDSIDAEVGIFQSLDVATSIVDDPAHAALAPFAFIIVFQLFDRRRKVAELDACADSQHCPPPFDRV